MGGRARPAAVIAWCTGMGLVIAGWPPPAAFTVAVAAAAAAVAALRWGPGWLAGLKVTAQLRHALGKVVGTVDRDDD
jgi:hypothetical protein